ncbi:unnamed protein product, partial [Tetraodon nigroviridis]
MVSVSAAMELSSLDPALMGAECPGPSRLALGPAAPARPWTWPRSPSGTGRWAALRRPAPRSGAGAPPPAGPCPHGCSPNRLLAPAGPWSHSCSTESRAAAGSRAATAPPAPAAPPPRAAAETRATATSDVIFLVSSADEALLCSPFLQDSLGHMVAPPSPAASSLDQGCYRRSPPLSSPSPDSSYSEESSDSSLDVLLHRARPVVLLSALSAVYQGHAPFSLQVSSDDDSDVIELELAPERPSRGRLADAAPQSDEDKAPPTQRRAKNDAVGIYYESCESDDGGDFADRPSTPLEADRKSPQTASEGRRQESKTVSRRRSTQLTNQTEGGKRGGDQRPEGVTPERRRDQTTANEKPRRRWRKRRRLQEPPPAAEPEIRLRYADVREEKKRRAGGFRPFVHVDERTCVIVNFREDEDSVRAGLGAGRSAPPSVPGFVPNTSCCQPGRCPPDGERRAALLCCLCGQTANAMALGDLHGPYRPAGPAGGQQDRDGGAGGAGADPGSPPKAPPEFWIHEDCGIWAAGVFLVRGRLYGLEEAARLAQETVCSVCQQAGAIMGCFLKSCGRSFHYRCAVQSGCVLNEENFSVRCSDHQVTLTCA